MAVGRGNVVKIYCTYGPTPRAARPRDRDLLLGADANAAQFLLIVPTPLIIHTPVSHQP